ncbi:phage replication O-like protein O [Evansella vedderi]|uniref:Phage replication O-like protein O n=1 Tax=Evansella vedderi TaxID=38282 RepID=A0ABU0A377_9BACI|nr:replication protein [Evansella vedderi]MDQ0257942.1 phage replication O-like protein O [Evansella vedderi]
MEHKTFTRFPNEIYDYILNPKQFTLAQLMIVLVVIRNTYGWNKEYFQVSNNELSILTGFSLKQIKRDVKFLVDQKVLIKEQEGNKKMRLKFNEPSAKNDAFL